MKKYLTKSAVLICLLTFMVMSLTACSNKKTCDSCGKKTENYTVYTYEGENTANAKKGDKTYVCVDCEEAMKDGSAYDLD